MKREAILAALVAMATTACTEDARPDPTQGSGGSSASSGTQSTTTTGVGGAESTGSGNAEAWGSGTRLKVRGLDGADGSFQPTGWFDSERAEDCDFAKLSDGAFHCVPLSPFAVHYSDPSCANPVFAPASQCASAPKYVASLGVAPCDGSPASRDIHTVTTTTIPSGSPLYSRIGAGCVSVSAVDKPTYTTTLISPSAFASALVSHE